MKRSAHALGLSSLAQFRVLLHHPVMRFLAALSVLSAVVACAAPTWYSGDEAFLGLGGISVGLVVGSMLCLFVVPALVLLMSRHAFEGRMLESHVLAGGRSNVVLCAQAVAACAAGLVFVMATALMTLLGGLTDQVVRAVLGPSGTPARVNDLASILLAAQLMATATGLCAFVTVLAARLKSGTGAAAVFVGLVGTWPLALVATWGMTDRAFLVMHPIAAPWALMNPTDSQIFSVDAPSVLYWASGVGWLVVGVLVVARGPSRTANAQGRVRTRSKTTAAN